MWKIYPRITSDIYCLGLIVATDRPGQGLVTHMHIIEPVIITSGIHLSLVRHQVIFWTSDDSIRQRIYTSLGLNVLMVLFIPNARHLHLWTVATPQEVGGLCPKTEVHRYLH